MVFRIARHWCIRSWHDFFILLMIVIWSVLLYLIFAGRSGVPSACSRYPWHIMANLEIATQQRPEDQGLRMWQQACRHDESRCVAGVADDLCGRSGRSRKTLHRSVMRRLAARRRLNTVLQVLVSLTKTVESMDTTFGRFLLGFNDLKRAGLGASGRDLLPFPRVTLDMLTFPFDCTDDFRYDVAWLTGRAAAALNSLHKGMRPSACAGSPSVLQLGTLNRIAGHCWMLVKHISKADNLTTDSSGALAALVVRTSGTRIHHVEG